MRTKYIDLIDQTFDFPQNEFNLREDRLFFHGIDLMRLINEYGTPLKFNYLPQVSTQMAQPFKFTKHYTGRLINRLK